MTYKELQTKLRLYREQGLTRIKLNSTKAELQYEYDLIQADMEETDEMVETIKQGIADKAVAKAKANLESVIRQRKRAGNNLISAYTRGDKDEIEGWGADIKRLETRKSELLEIINAYENNDLDKFFELSA